MGTEPDDAGSDAGRGPEKTYKITASVVGLAGSGLVLQDASGASIPVTAGAATQTVTISAAAKAGTAYEVSVKTQPSAPTQRCSGGEWFSTSPIYCFQQWRPATLEVPSAILPFERTRHAHPCSTRICLNRSLPCRRLSERRHGD